MAAAVFVDNYLGYAMYQAGSGYSYECPALDLYRYPSLHRLQAAIRMLRAERAARRAR